MNEAGATQISFLGTGNYEVTRYELDGVGYETMYVAEAIARRLDVRLLNLVATPSAWAAHGAALVGRLEAAGITWRRLDIPEGAAPSEQWALFEVLRVALAEAPAEVVLDITHGFRSQPFLCAAVLAYHRSTRPKPNAVRVLYGVWSRGAAIAPVWDLAPVIETVDWASGLRTLMTTGRAAEVVDAVEPIGAQAARAWAEAGKVGPAPQLRGLARALTQYSADLTLLRTDDLCGRQGSAARLVRAIDDVRDEVKDRLPPLAPVLGELRERASPLAAAALTDPEGATVLVALTQLYVDLDRWLEAVTVAREARISQYCEVDARSPAAGASPAKFDALRAEGEARWRACDHRSRVLAEVRNTLDHAGFQGRPLPAKVLAGRVRDEVVALSLPVLVVNFSQTPCESWDPAQRAAAWAFGTEIVDRPLPPVPLDLDDITPMVDDVVASLPKDVAAAILGGDPLFVLGVMARMEGRGVACYAEVRSADGAFVKFRRFQMPATGGARG